MCRLFAYISVNPILLDDVLRRPKHAITQQIQAQFQGRWFLNADGFGITWHTEARSRFNPFKGDQSAGEQHSGHRVPSGLLEATDGPTLPFVRGPHPAIYKTTLAKPLNDPTFLSLCANVSSRCIFAHLRAALTPPVATTNNHPFVFGRHCFMHNGNISNFREIRKEMLRHISAGFDCMIEGGTDTEHLAALYMSYLCEPKDFQGAGKHYSASSMWKALKSAIQMVDKIQRNRGMTPDNILNICTTDGESLLALCYRSPGSTEPYDLWVSVNVADILNRKPHTFSHGCIFEDTRSDDDIDKAACDLRRDAKRVLQRGPNGQLIGIEPALQRILQEEEHLVPFKHGPHIIVASEPTTIGPDWFKLVNGDVILVDTVWKGDHQTIDVSPETW